MKLGDTYAGKLAEVNLNAYLIRLIKEDLPTDIEVQEEGIIQEDIGIGRYVKAKGEIQQGTYTKVQIFDNDGDLVIEYEDYIQIEQDGEYEITAEIIFPTT